MNTNVDVNRNPLWSKTDELVRSVLGFSDTLPNSQSQDLSLRLKQCIGCVTPYIEAGLKHDSKLDKIRCWQVVNAILAECRVYLNLAEAMNFGKTRKLIDRVDEVSKMIISSYFGRTVH
ncbi:MAG: hypothetical protein QG635_426 [Bacteroidota bacterium]|nr:hypothetical protein [Bacteroidota bacterium]